MSKYENDFASLKTSGAKKIGFEETGTLLVPCDWMEPPEVKIGRLNRHKSKQKECIYMYDQDEPTKRTAYHFKTSDKTDKRWKNWHSIGWQDIEVGYMWLSATYDSRPEYWHPTRVTWFIDCYHDGAPYDEESYEWCKKHFGWIIYPPSVTYFDNNPDRGSRLEEEDS